MIETVTTARTNDTNDVVINSHGDIELVSGKEAYKNIISAAILTKFGELAYNYQRGVPYFSSIFLNSRSIPLWENAVKTTIKSFAFVVSVKSFKYDIDFKNRVVSYVAEIETDEGDINIEGNAQ